MKHPLPRGWKYKLLSEIGDAYTGNTPSTKDKNNYGNDYLFVTPADIKENKYITDSERKLSSKGFSISRKFKKGDILYVSIGSTIGKIAIADKELTTNQQINVLRVNEENYNEFVYYQLINSFKSFSHLISTQAVPILNKTSFENISILLPPIDEQKRIAEVLSLCDKLIENLTKLIEKKEIYKKGVMQRVLSGEVRFNGFTDEWENVKLKDILIVGSKDRVLDTSKYKKITIKLHNKGIEFSNIERKMADKRPFYIRKKDEIIIGKQNYFNGSIAIVGEEFDNTICSNAIMSFTVNKNCNNKFIYFLLSRKSYMQKYYHLANGTGQKELSESDFLNFNLLIPRLEEQNKIAELLTLIDKDIEILKQLLHLRKLQKKGLMQKLLTGEVRI